MHLSNVGKPKTELKLQGWCVTSTLFLMFPIRICNVSKPYEIISCHALTHIHTFPSNYFMFHIFDWLCNLSLIGPIYDPSMLVTCMERNETYEKWIPGHVHHVQMTHQFMYGP
jgi:hypothetical protein